MKLRLLLFLIALILFILISCQPKSTTKIIQQAPVDSALYYQQADIADPFLDTIFQTPDQPITIAKTIYPPAQPAELRPEFKEVEGFRVQVFAGIDSISAQAIRAEVKTVTVDSVHYLVDKGLYKIQVGDYLYRYLADNVKTRMRTNGYPGAWVLQRKIIVPIDTTFQDTLIISEKIPETAVKDTGAYKIQLVATASLEKAEEIVRNIQTQTEFKVFYEESGNLYKVYVGLFKSEQRARDELTKLRDLGYPDAWLVY